MKPEIHIMLQIISSHYHFVSWQAMATPLLSAVTTLAAAAYLNAKLGVSIDLQQLRYDREWHARFIQRLQSLGDTCTLYRIFELADHGAEALWFEGRGWTYRQLKKGKSRFPYIGKQ